MAATTVSFSVRTDPLLKKQVDLFLENVGMSMSTAINLYLRKIVMEQRIPFDISLPPLEQLPNLASRYVVRGLRQMYAVSTIVHEFPGGGTKNKEAVLISRACGCILCRLSCQSKQSSPKWTVQFPNKEVWKPCTNLNFLCRRRGCSEPVS